MEPDHPPILATEDSSQTPSNKPMENENRPGQGRPPVKKRDYRQPDSLGSPSNNNDNNDDNDEQMNSPPQIDKPLALLKPSSNNQQTHISRSDQSNVEKLSSQPTRTSQIHNILPLNHSQINPSVAPSLSNDQDEDTPMNDVSINNSNVDDLNKNNKDNRRYTSDRLRASGISNDLLIAVDKFITSIPIIPKHLGEKTYKRNMRAWITDLEKPDLEPKWKELLSVLEKDPSPYQVWHDEWDQTLCRHIITQVVYRDQDHSGHTKQQSRQAINNAIRRELECPSLTGNTQRGKTFRDLFRQKCGAENVVLPALKGVTSSGRLSTTTTSKPVAHGPLGPNSELYSNSTRANVIKFQRSAESFTRTREQNEARLKEIHKSCPDVDEWSQTAWWRLKDDTHVRELPSVLVQVRVSELRTLLLDFRWIMRTFKCLDFQKGMYQLPTAGYDELLFAAGRPNSVFPPMEIEGFRLIRNALMLILPILATDLIQSTHNKFAHLATQLTGRLLDLKRRFPTIACFLKSIERYAPRPWLRPFTVCFQPPRADVALAVPSTGIYIPHLIALSDNGSLLVASGRVGPGSCNSFHFLKGQRSHDSQTRDRQYLINLWDVRTGELKDIIENVEGAVLDIAIAPDNTAIIVATMQGLFIWHLKWENGDFSVVPTPTRAKLDDQQMHGEDRLAASKNGTILLTRSSKHRIDMWDLRTGDHKRQFSTESTTPQCIDVSTQGYDFVTGHDNGVIALWTLESEINTPALCFANNGTRGIIQSVRTLKGSRRDLTSYGVMSVSCQEKDSFLRLASVSKTGIRIWNVPPARLALLNSDFVAFRCLACFDLDPYTLRSNLSNTLFVQSVQWSASDMLFSGGDDRIVRVWEELDNGEWITYSIGREWSSRIDPQGMGSVLVSGGRSTDLVATYETKSPYVTVWKANQERYKAQQEREKSYQPFCPLISHSIDAKDTETLLDGKSPSVKPANRKFSTTKMHEIISGMFVRNENESEAVENPSQQPDSGLSSIENNGMNENRSRPSPITRTEDSLITSKEQKPPLYGQVYVNEMRTGVTSSEGPKLVDDTHRRRTNGENTNNGSSLGLPVNGTNAEVSTSQALYSDGHSRVRENTSGRGRENDNGVEGGNDQILNTSGSMNLVGSGNNMISSEVVSNATASTPKVTNASGIDGFGDNSKPKDNKNAVVRYIPQCDDHQTSTPRIKYEIRGTSLEICFEGLVYGKTYAGKLHQDPTRSGFASLAKSSADVGSSSGQSSTRYGAIGNRGHNGMMNNRSCRLDPDKMREVEEPILGLGVVLEDRPVLFQIEYADETNNHTKFLLSDSSDQVGKTTTNTNNSNDENETILKVKEKAISDRGSKSAHGGDEAIAKTKRPQNKRRNISNKDGDNEAHGSLKKNTSERSNRVNKRLRISGSEGQ